MAFIRNESGQTAILFVFCGGLLLLGAMYILLGSFMGTLLTVNNDLINSHAIPYSQDHKNALDNLFRIWWFLPVIFILLFIFYVIKKGLEKQQGDLYS